jgi:glycine/D-amino acid oxidase-like deaminating enzyme/nitrite reductase/ring-hydroxylating ferredoxin subunit
VSSLWLDRAQPVPDDPLRLEEPLDDVVVGAGLTGLTTGLLLARAGRRVAVVEARTVGAVTTGHSTAKVSLLQGTRLSRILRHQSERVAAAYVEANREGQQWLLRFCDDHGVDVQRRPAITYAASPTERSSATEEHRACRLLGLDADWQDALDVPFPHHGAVVLPDQAQLDPLDLLGALAAELRRHGGTLHQHRRVVGAAWADPGDLELDGGQRLRAGTVVLATGTPVLDRGLYFAKLQPERSYALVFDQASPPDGMYLSAGSDARSVRGVEDAGRRLLMVGGAGHVVGRTRSERSHLDALRSWTATYFPGAVETHAWSAQDYRSHDWIPYVGRLPRGRGRAYVATGYDKWGLTNAVAAALAIASEILGRPVSWSQTLGRRVTRPSAGIGIVDVNARVGGAAVWSALGALAHGDPAPPGEGCGRRGRQGVVPTGVATTDGASHAVRALCTHLGGVLTWNDAERSWDCPLHGSRFAADGSVLEGPATRPLPTRPVHAPAPETSG